MESLNFLLCKHRFAVESYTEQSLRLARLQSKYNIGKKPEILKKPKKDDNQDTAKKIDRFCQKIDEIKIERWIKDKINTHLDKILESDIQNRLNHIKKLFEKNELSYIKAELETLKIKEELQRKNQKLQKYSNCNKKKENIPNYFYNKKIQKKAKKLKKKIPIKQEIKSITKEFKKKPYLSLNELLEKNNNFSNFDENDIIKKNDKKKNDEFFNKNFKCKILYNKKS